MSCLSRSFLAPLALLLALAAPACVVIDVTADHEAGGFKSTGLIGGYATAGWPSDDSLLKLGLLDGRSDGAIFLLQVWKLVRVEVGLLGLAVGLGPLDAGVGILFYDPEPPAYCNGDEDGGDECAEDECDECDDDDEDDD
jgi:opacity protein-like surface antigen